MAKGNAVNLEKDYKTRMSIFVLLGRLLIVQALLVVASVVLNGELFAANFENVIIQFVSQSLFLLLMALVLTFSVIVVWFYRYYVITPEGIYLYKGVIFRQMDNFDMKSVRKVTVEQGLMGRIFNYGDIVMESPLISHDIRLHNIHKPTKVVKLIEKQRLKHVTNAKSVIVPA